MSKKVAKKVTQEIESIEIPSELQQRSKLGIQQAKQEMRKTTRKKRFLKNTAAVAAGIVLAVSLGAATSPTFASFVKSLFWSSDVDEGLKNAVHQGYSEVVDMEVTDQRITLKVKEVISDPYRVSVLFGLEKDGKSLNASPLIYGDNLTDDPELNPSLVNKVEILDESGYKLDRSFSSRNKSIGNDIMIYFSLEDINDSSSLHEVANIPDNIFVDFDIVQIGDTTGQWHLNVPIDLAAAKTSVNTIALNKRYDSPFGFSIDFLQFRHGPSKSELLYRFNKIRDPRKSIHYEIKDNKDHVLASFDELTAYEVISEGKVLENKNYLHDFSDRMWDLGFRKQWDGFVPFKNKDELRLELKTVYTVEKAEAFSAVFHGNEILKEPLVKDYEGKIFTFTTRMKTEEAEERFPDGEEAFSGTGWIIEVDQLLDSDTVKFLWKAEDEHGEEMYQYSEMHGVEMERKVIGSRDENGHYHNREWFFFNNKGTIPAQVTLHFNEYLRANAVNWSIPLESSLAPLPKAELGFDVPITELEPAITKKAEQAFNELIPNQPVEVIGANNADDAAWSVYSTDGSMARIDKKTGKLLNVFRDLPYDKADKKIRKLAEHTIEELEPKLSNEFKRMKRSTSAKEGVWILSGNRATVFIDGLTERVEASLSYTAEEIDFKKKEAAQHAYAVMTNGKKLRLADGEQIKTSGEHIWDLESRGKSFRVHIGARTNTLWSVSMLSQNDYIGDAEFQEVYAEPYYTSEAAVAAAGPIVKKLFNIDLDGYQVKVHLNEYTFQRNGEPTIKAKINTQGTFWEYQLVPEEGIKD